MTRGGPDADLALKKGPKVDVRGTQCTQQIKRTIILVYYKTARNKKILGQSAISLIAVNMAARLALDLPA